MLLAGQSANKLFAESGQFILAFVPDIIYSCVTG
jgi:hypothetical protein